jgi:hypothetical protein
MTTDQKPESPTRQTSAITAALFLNAEFTAELEGRLAHMHANRVTAFTGLWCADTGFAVVVEVTEGVPFQWHLRGPLSRDGAKTWLGIVQAEICASAELSRVTH